MKILIRGGSIAAGFGVTTGYVDHLQAFCASRGVEVINRSGYRQTTFDALWSFDEDIEPVSPAILVLHFGIDDAFHPVYRSEFKENLVQLVRRARTRFAPEIFMLTSHLLPDRYEMDAVNTYYRAIHEVCRDLDCEMVPVHIYWARYLERHVLSILDPLQFDARYPNEEGHIIYAEALITCLGGILPPS